MNGFLFVVLVFTGVVIAIMFGVASLVAKFAPTFPVPVSILFVGLTLVVLLRITSYLAERQQRRILAKIDTPREWTDQQMGHAIGMGLLRVCRWVTGIVATAMAAYFWLAK